MRVREAHSRAYEKWSAGEDAELAQFVASGETIEEIAVRLRRQPGPDDEAQPRED